MLDFGVVKTRGTKVSQVEKYDYPVLTVMPKVEDMGHVQKFDFNQAAINAMQFDLSKECFVGLAFDDNKNIVIVNLGNNQTKVYAKVNKDYTFNSKRIYDILQKNLKFDTTKVHEFAVNINPDETGYIYAAISHEIVAFEETMERVSLNETIDDIIDVEAEEIENEAYYILKEEFELAAQSDSFKTEEYNN